MSDKMREAFEKWYMTNTFAHVDHLSVFYNDLNCYSTPIANQCWKAWQAAQSYCPSPDPVKLAELGWQMIECPICGGGAQAFPQQAAQSVPVVGEPVAWVVNTPIRNLHFSKSEEIGLGGATQEPLYRASTHSITAAELATLRENAARIEQVEKERDEANARLHDVSVACATAEQEREELRKALLALKEDCQTSNDCQYGTLSTSHVARIVDAAIAQGKGE